MTWKKDGKEEKPEKDSVKEKLKDKKVKCRICDGEHFTARCPFKDTMAPMGEDGVAAAGGAGGIDGGDEEETKVGGLGTGGGGYVPPHLRKGAAASGERMGGKYERDDLATLRVTNVRLFPYLPLQRLRWLMTLIRFPNLQKKTIFETFSHASDMLLEFSSPRTETAGERKVLLSLALLIGQMLRKRVRSSMAVSSSLRGMHYWTLLLT